MSIPTAGASARKRHLSSRECRHSFAIAVLMAIMFVPDNPPRLSGTTVLFKDTVIGAGCSACLQESGKNNINVPAQET